MTKATYTFSNEFYEEQVCFPDNTACSSNNIKMKISDSVTDNPYADVVGGFAGLAFNQGTSAVPATDNFLEQLNESALQTANLETVTSVS